MKRILVLASIAAITLSSCNKTEKIKGGAESDNPTISFETYLGGQTKGLSKDAFRMGDQFSTFGVKTAVAFDVTAPAFTQYVFGNATNSVVVTHFGLDGGGNAIWNYDELTPWDENRATFFAYSPVPQGAKTFGVSNPTISDGTIPTIDYQVVGGYDPVIVDLSDPTVATARELIKTQPDLLRAFSPNNTRLSGAIELEFRHTLSQIRFSARGHHNTGLLRINSVTLKSVNTSATLALANDPAQEGSFDYLGGWGAATNPQNFAVNLQTDAVSAIPATAVGNDPVLWPITDDDESLMLIPQVLTGIGLEVRYSYSRDGIEWIDYESGTALDYVLSTLSSHWNPNKRYNYILSINPGKAITFTSTIDPWEPIAGTSDLEYRTFESVATAGAVLRADGTTEEFDLREGDIVTGTYDTGADWLSARDALAASTVVNGTPMTITAANAGKWTFNLLANATGNARTVTIVVQRAPYDKTLADGSNVKVTSGVAKYVVRQN